MKYLIVKNNIENIWCSEKSVVACCCVHYGSNHGGQKCQIPLELKLQVFVSCLMLGLAIKIKSVGALTTEPFCHPYFLSE